MSEFGGQTERLAKARVLLEQGMGEKSFAMVMEHLLESPADVDGLNMLTLLMTEANREDSADKIRTLSKAIDAAVTEGVLPFGDKQMILPMFEAAFALIDLRQFELATKYLSQCVQLAPEEPVIRYEFAFALMALKRFEEALPHFEQAAAELKDFDSYLNLAVCHALVRNLAAAQSTFDQLAQIALSEDEKKELSHRRFVLRRLGELSAKKELNTRDWLYALYGTVLLHPGYKKNKGPEDIKTVASNLLVLRGMLAELRMEFDVVEFYNLASKPIAKVLGELMDLPVDGYKGPERPDRALLVMAWATDIIGPHKAFIETSEKRTLFAYGLPWQEPLPLTPEIVGCLSDEFPMPWSEELRDNAIEDIVSKIVERARDLDCDPDILEHVQKAIEYYHLKRERLIVGNHEGFPERPEYTAEIPDTTAQPIQPSKS